MLKFPKTVRTIWCAGRNYKDHALELKNPLPKEPLFFLKPPSSIIFPPGPILLPKVIKEII